MVRKSLLSAACAAALLAVPAASAQASSWTSPARFPGADVALDDVQTAFDAEGNGVAVWAAPGGGADRAVWYSTRPAGGSWSAEPTLVSAHDDIFGIQLRVAPDGAAIISYARGVRAEAIVRTAGGSFEAAPEILASTGADTPDVAIGADGTFYAAYAQSDAVYVRERAAEAAEWSFADELPASAHPDTTYDAQLDVDAEGRVAVAWTSGWIPFEPTDPGVTLEVATRSAGGSWSTTMLESDAPVSPEADVAYDADGRGAVVWTQDGDGVFDLDDPDARTVASRIDGTAVSAPVAIEGTETVTSTPDPVELLEDGSGTIVAALRQWPDLKVATLPAEADAFEPAEVATGADARPYGGNGDGQAWDFAVRAGGEMAVSWSGMDGPVHVARRAAEGGWTLDDAVQQPENTYVDSTDVAFDPHGNIVLSVVRQVERDGTNVGDFAVYDRTAPQLGSATFATSGIAGTPAAFSASAVDDWSPVSLKWSFGDGATAEGASVGHAFAAAGSYPVSVAAHSAGGSSAAQTETIAVAATPVHEPDPGTGTDTGTVTTTGGTPAQAPQPPAPSGPAPLTAQQVAVALATFPKAPVVTVRDLVAKGVPFSQRFPGAGQALWQLYLNRPPAKAGARASAAKPVLLGTLKKRIAGAGPVTARVKVAKKGRKALKGAKAKRTKVFLKTVFTDASGRKFAAVRAVKIK